MRNVTNAGWGLATKSASTGAYKTIFGSWPFSFRGGTEIPEPQVAETPAYSWLWQLRYQSLSAEALCLQRLRVSGATNAASQVQRLDSRLELRQAPGQNHCASACVARLFRLCNYIRRFPFTLRFEGRRAVFGVGSTDRIGGIYLEKTNSDNADRRSCDSWPDFLQDVRGRPEAAQATGLDARMRRIRTQILGNLPGCFHAIRTSL